MLARRLLAGALVLAAATTLAGAARGQCAAQASSCVQCHETEGRFKVRANGTTWHADHAIGDFCAGCHGGKPECGTAAEAHQGIATPLLDPARSCAPCHAETFTALAARYARDAAARKAEPPRPAPEPAAAPGDATRNDGVAAMIVAALAVAAAAAMALTEQRRRPMKGGAS